MQSGYRASRRRLQCAERWVMTLVLLVAAAMVQAAVPATVGTRPAPQRTVLVMGDSLSAAYGLAPSQGWVALTGARVARGKPGWRVVNASISGETSAGGAARVVQIGRAHV